MANKPQPVTRDDYLSLAGLLQGKGGVQRVLKKDPHGEALRTAAEMYENREYVAAYECFRPACDKVVSDMQRILARNVEFEANKLARDQRKPLAVAKENVQSMRVHAEQVIEQFDRLLRDLESKPLVRLHLKKGRPRVDADATPEKEVAPPSPDTAISNPPDTTVAPAAEIVSGAQRYVKLPYAPPKKGAIYSVRDKSQRERIIIVTDVIEEGVAIQADTIENGNPINRPIRLVVESLSHQAAKGWCTLLISIYERSATDEEASQPPTDGDANVNMRLDSQNFGRCCADINRANIKFSTQLIKDVADGPFRAGNYEQAFLTFEQLAVQFNASVGASRRAIADGRRALTAEKGKMSGKEIQERTAAFIRSEQLIQTAEREFSTILEGLRMYLRARQG
jgi:hypothetical protein